MKGKNLFIIGICTIIIFVSIIIMFFNNNGVGTQDNTSYTSTTIANKNTIENETTNYNYPDYNNSETTVSGNTSNKTVQEASASAQSTTINLSNDKDIVTVNFKLSNTKDIENTLPFVAHATIMQKFQLYLSTNGYDKVTEVTIISGSVISNNSVVSFKCANNVNNDITLVAYDNNKVDFTFSKIISR